MWRARDAACSLALVKGILAGGTPALHAADAAPAAHKAMLDEHAELFRADEELFLPTPCADTTCSPTTRSTRPRPNYHAEKDHGLGELFGGADPSSRPHMPTGTPLPDS